MGSRTQGYLLLGLAVCLFFCDTMGSIVTTNWGRIRGLTTGGVDIFKGIPYGKADRFEYAKSPEPLEVNATFNATGDGPLCPPWPLPGVKTSEDCLSLTVFTPEEANVNSSLPVLFFVPGDVFYVQDARPGIYDGSAMARDEKLVVVTINYRTGPFGFLTSEKSNISKNIGLEDFKLALKWVQDNINKFGGLPGLVTVAGQGSGGVMVSLMAADPAMKEMYRRIYLMSDFTLFPYAILDEKEAEQRFKTFLGLVGCRDFDLARSCLENKTMEELVNATWNMPNNFPQIGFGIVSKNRGSMFRFNSANSVMIGMVNQEATFFVNQAPPQFKTLANLTRGLSTEEFQNLIYNLDFIKYTTNQTREALLYEYTNWAKPNDNQANMRSFLDLMTDAMVRVPSLLMASKFVEHSNSTVFLYQWERSEGVDFWGNEVPPAIGAPHGQSLFYIFNRPIASNASKEVAKSFRDAVAKFMRTGFPDGNATHPKSCGGEPDGFPDVCVLGQGSEKNVQNFLSDKRAFWTSYLPQTTMIPPTTPTNPATTTHATTKGTPTTEDDDEEERKALIALTVIFGVLFLIFLVVVIVLCIKYRKTGKYSKSLDDVSKYNKGQEM